MLISQDPGTPKTGTFYSTSLKQATKNDKMSQAYWEMTLLVLVCPQLAKALEQREEEHMAIPPQLKPTCFPVLWLKDSLPSLDMF